MLTRHATCLCGACHATTTAEPVLVTACACHDCQLESGSAFGYNAFFPESAVATEGQTQGYTHTFASSRSQTAHRCATCGSPMWFTMDAVPGTIGLRAGTFVDADFPPPGAFYYTARKHHWLTLPDGLCTHDTDVPARHAPLYVPAPPRLAARMTPDRILPGVVLMLAFCVLAPLLDVASKLAAATIPVGQITTARFVVQGTLMLPVALVMGLGWHMSRHTAVLIGLRAVFLILSTYCFVAALRVMPVADALVIAFVEPFILLILGRLIFGDEVGPRRIAASVVGFGGALLVIQPSLAVFGTVALFPLGTAFFFAFYMLLTRQLTSAMHPVTMQLHTSIAGSLVCVPLMWAFNGSGIVSLDPVMPQGIAWLWLFGVGGCAAVSHIIMTYALKFAPAATLAPLHYLEIVAAVALGYAVFNDFPNAMTWAGIATIVSSGLYIIHRERMVARHRRAAGATAAPVR